MFAGTAAGLGRSTVVSRRRPGMSCGRGTGSTVNCHGSHPIRLSVSAETFDGSIVSRKLCTWIATDHAARRSQATLPARVLVTHTLSLLSFTAALLVPGHTPPLGRQDHVGLRQPSVGEAVRHELDLNAPCHRAARRPARDTHPPPPPSLRSTTRHPTAHADADQRSTTGPTAP
jgi:hypothetical protein